MSSVISLAHKMAERDWRASLDTTQTITCFLPRHDNVEAITIAAKLFPFSNVLADRASGVAYFGEDVFDKGQVLSMGLWAGAEGIELKIAAYMPVVGQSVSLRSPFDVAMIDARDPLPNSAHYEVLETRHDGQGVRVLVRRELAALAPDVHRRIVIAASRLAAQKSLWIRMVEGVKSWAGPRKQAVAGATVIALPV